MQNKAFNMNKQLPLEDFFRNSERTGYQLSPDGTYISYMAPYKDRLNVFVRRIGETDAQATRITHETERSVAGYMWADNQRLLFMKDTAGDENYQLYGVRRDGSDERAYTAFEGVRTSRTDIVSRKSWQHSRMDDRPRRTSACGNGYC